MRRTLIYYRHGHGELGGRHQFMIRQPAIRRSVVSQVDACRIVEWSPWVLIMETRSRKELEDYRRSTAWTALKDCLDIILEDRQ